MFCNNAILYIFLFKTKTLQTLTMSKSTLYILILLLIGWMILGAWLCCRFLAVGCGDEENKVTEKSSYLWSLADGDNFTAGANDQFDFVNSNQAYLPLLADLDGLVDRTSEYLNANPTRSLNIVGKYTDTETNNTILPTLGLARANQLRQLFVDHGVESKRITTGDMLVETALSAGDTLFNGIGLSIGDYVVAEDDRIPRIQSEIVGQPIKLYFPTGQQEVNLTAEQRNIFADIIYYLDNVDGSNLTVNGYTDNTGNLGGNQRLSRKRAEFVRDYLTGNGISTSKMTATGFGPDNPVATNDTDEGRALNRRVEVTLN